MAQNKTNTYQIAKNVFDTLASKEDMIVDVKQEYMPIFRKHLSEMIRRKKSSNKYVTRLVNNNVVVFRIQ